MEKQEKIQELKEILLDLNIRYLNNNSLIEELFSLSNVLDDIKRIVRAPEKLYYGDSEKIIKTRWPKRA